MVRFLDKLDIGDWHGLFYDQHIHKSRKLKRVFLAFAGATVNIPIARTIQYPFDRLVHASIVSNYSPSGSLSIRPLLVNTNLSQAVSSIAFSSLASAICLTINESAQYKSGVSWKKHKYPKEIDSIKEFAYKAYACGSFAGFFSTLLTYPVQLSKRMVLIDESNRKTYTGLSNCTAQRYFFGSYPALFHGVSFSLFSSSIFYGLLLGGYETLKILRSPGQQPFTLNDRIISGYVSSLCSLAVTHPMETIRLTIASSAYQSINNILKIKPSRVIKGHCSNPLNLTRGISLVPIKAIPLAATLIVYDLTVTWKMDNRPENRR